MTLIIGAYYRDGLMLCSDREENTELGGKRSVNKLLIRGVSDSIAMVIGTAGHSALCEIAVKKIEAAMGEMKEDFLPVYEEKISELLADIYQKHVPDSLGERAIKLVIGVQDATTRRHFLYCTSEDLMKPEVSYCCAGAGLEVGYYYLDRLYTRDMTLAEMVNFLTFVMREAKESVGRVGVGTDIIAMQKSGASLHHFTWDYLAVLEQRLPKLSECISDFWKEEY
jgi:20S proteasome alpha/beta subunit